MNRLLIRLSTVIAIALGSYHGYMVLSADHISRYDLLSGTAFLVAGAALLVIRSGGSQKWGCVFALVVAAADFVRNILRFFRYAVHYIPARELVSWDLAIYLVAPMAVLIAVLIVLLRQQKNA